MTKFISILAVTVLAGCGARMAAVPPQDKELSRDMRLARAAFDDGEATRAVDLYSRALKRATAMDDAPEIVNAAYNLALCQVILGRLDQAGAALADAWAALRRSGSHPADVLLLEATIAQRQEKWELALADQVLAASPAEGHRLQVALLQGAVACRQGDLARAKTAWAEADKYRSASAALLAGKERLAGNIFWQEGKPAEAAAAFDRAAALFRTAQHYRDMALALHGAGQAYQKAGDTQRAQDRLARAERSLAAQGEKTPSAQIPGSSPSPASSADGVDIRR